MRFRDLLPHFQGKSVGRVIQADWDPAEHGIRFTIRFEPSGRTLQGTCKAGVDPATGTFISETDLRAKIPKLRDLPIYENATSGDPNTLSVEEFRKMKIHFSLSNLNFSYHSETRQLEINTLLSRSLRR
jgi:hypothetical protein